MSNENAASLKKQFGLHSADPNKPMMQRMLDGELYNPDDQECLKEMEKTKQWMGRFNASIGLAPAERLALLKERIGTLSEGAIVMPPFYCDYGINLHLGPNVFINYNCCFLDVCRVDIGENTMLGPAVQIYTADHPRDLALRKQQWEFGRPIWIGRNVWIGGGVGILAGIRVGDNAVIGAGAVVTRDVAEGTTVVGNPARPLTAKKQ